ncbi:MAG TPA: hypothetical protein VFA07_14880 [Chthonomonadaceae bacterium]|nr:hypothetical protein [Chthonomonadaceae bacterium]
MMTLPWNREQQRAETRARWGWIVGGTLAVGIIAAAAVWLMRTAQEQAAGQMQTMDNDYAPDLASPSTAVPAGGMKMQSEEAIMPPAGKKRSGRSKKAGAASIENAQPADLTKMGSGAEELRNHDFPAPISRHRSAEEDPITVNQNVLLPEDIQAGGEIGEMPGDMQPVGEAINIMDQDELTPDFAQEEG